MAEGKPELFIQQTGLSLCLTKAAQQSVTKAIAVIPASWVTPKAEAKPELLLNKPVSVSV
jgi:hypothetical protein